MTADIAAEYAALKALGFKRKDANVVIGLRELEVEDRHDSLKTMRTFYNALDIGGQGELFPEPPAAGFAASDALN